MNSAKYEFAHSPYIINDGCESLNLIFGLICIFLVNLMA